MNTEKQIYKASEVKIRVVEITDNKKEYLVFSTLLETQFYSPGVNIKYGESNDAYIQFVRSPIKGDVPTFALKANYLQSWLKTQNLSTAHQQLLLSNGASGDQIVELPKKAIKIYVDDGEIKSLAWKKAP